MTREEKHILRHKFILGLKAWRAWCKPASLQCIEDNRYRLFNFMTQRVRMGIISKEQFARLVIGVIKWR